MERSYRIKANIGIDQVLNVNLKQDVDLYEILSLNLKQDSLYKLQSSDYGVIVGRVLANDAFGVPNAKVTVFIPLSEEDSLRDSISSIYPYKSVTDYNSKNIKFNTLPNYKKFDCHQAVGSFPKKELVLDDDSVLEVYDKYYKYSTVTNNAGDYMIFGVPTGEQIIHVDVDLSDIGILSQEPRDFIYKGYSINMFESPTQFKKGTDLDNLAQIHNENAAVTVFPFWGDKSSNNISITRKDINLQYKFETTCVFLGSVITDNNPNSVSYNCIPDEGLGEAGQLSPSNGNIEMIRKTIDDKVEEFPIKGNQLIDSDGVWCYQIPMNLDYVGMDEYGNIVPTDNPTKGIPTRARVRFRFTLDESGADSLTRHKARYLVPNNPDLYQGHLKPTIKSDIIDNDTFYEFGTLTPDECFRDLYWNKVYSVKSYIPRLQMSKHEKTSNYLAIKGVNKKDAKKNNPLPFNKLNLNITPAAYQALAKFGKGDEQVSAFWGFLKSNSVPYNLDVARENILEEMDGIGLDFYNDWLNGCLYFPSWFWLIKKKKKYKEGESVYESSFCECKREDNDSIGNLYLYNNCSLVYDNYDLTVDRLRKTGDKIDYPMFGGFTNSINFGSKNFYSGIIKKITNKDGLDIFYYTFGNKLTTDKKGGDSDFDNSLPEELRPGSDTKYYDYARLFSTDIILLGSLKDCDIDGVPKASHSFPSTTSNIPPMGRYKYNNYALDGENDIVVPSYEDEDKEENLLAYNGMNWGNYWYRRVFMGFDDESASTKSSYKYKYGSGLFFGISTVYAIYENLLDWIFGPEYTIKPISDTKTCVNAERISELGVTLDSEVNIDYDINGEKYTFRSEVDGLITKRELSDIDSRALFASLNHNKLIGVAENPKTGYKTYDLTYLYPTNFDGRMEVIAPSYTDNATQDVRNKDYLDYRFGSNEAMNINTVRSATNRFGAHLNDNETTSTRGNSYDVEDGYISFSKYIMPKNRHFYGYDNTKDTVYPLQRMREALDDYKPNKVDYQYSFPLYENSFYFYFGLNQGSTAIDKFYSQFYSECANERVSNFIVKITPYPSYSLNAKNGRLLINVQEIDTPYVIEVKLGDETVFSKDSITSENTVVSGLSNGVYTVIITDAYGNQSVENVSLNYQKIVLETNLIRGILTEYVGQSCSEICSNDYYAKLEIVSYTVNGQKSMVGTLNGSDGEYVLNGDTNFVMKITPKDDDAEFSTYSCSCTPSVGEKSGNVININRPGVFSIKVVEKINGKETDNAAYYTITVPDTKKMEMYVNDVPLTYIVGDSEELLSKYNPYFFSRTASPIGAATDTQVSGWFGLHNPDTYAEVFRTPLKNSKYKSIWHKDIGTNDALDILKSKFEYMFNLSSGAYVSSNSNNHFVVDLDGAEGELLLRSAHPIYDNFEYKGNSFNTYATNGDDIVMADVCNANIVSENYRYIDNMEGFPMDGAYKVNGDTSLITGYYGFNPKYVNKINNAGNYFAGFSNNANIVQTAESSCEKNLGAKPYQVLPYKANDLFGDGMCLNSEKKSILSSVYSGNRYLRTEFIDRRFDYDVFYISPHKCNHYGETPDIWNMGRISALTYNGIEMEYADTDSKTIINPSGAEYSYNSSTAEITLNNGKKRFYESKLYYDNDEYVELINAYRYKKNTNSEAYYSDKNGIEAEYCTCNAENSISEDTFDNFGTVNGTVYGYPSKRWVDYYKIPYGDRYRFLNVSCSYDGISVEKKTSGIFASAVKGETVTHSVEVGELVNIKSLDFEKGEYNIEYSGTPNNSLIKLTSSKINRLDFSVKSEGSVGFKSKIDAEDNRTGIRICRDTKDHTNMGLIKSATTLTDAIRVINSEKICEVPIPDEIKDYYDTTQEFTNYIFDVKNKDLRLTDQYLFITLDRQYYSQATDSLMKRIRVLNASTVYNVTDFELEYTLHDVKEKEGDAEVSGTIPDKNNSSNQEAPELNDEGQTIESSGTSTQKYDFTVFTFKSGFLKNCLDKVMFEITYDGETFSYFPKMQKVGDDMVKCEVYWDKHKKIMEDDTTAKMVFYAKIKDEIKSDNEEGYMVFASAIEIDNNKNIKKHISLNS